MPRDGCGASGINGVGPGVRAWSMPSNGACMNGTSVAVAGSVGNRFLVMWLGACPILSPIKVSKSVVESKASIT